jgi:hypothetical protein
MSMGIAPFAALLSPTKKLGVGSPKDGTAAKTPVPQSDYGAFKGT